MTKISRRGLFGALLGAVVVPWERVRSKALLITHFRSPTTYYPASFFVGLTRQDIEAAANYKWNAAALVHQPPSSVSSTGIP